MKSKYRIWIYLFPTVLFFLAGCQEDSVRPSANGGGPAYMVTIDQLAAKLGLSITDKNMRYHELSNSSNRVLLFTHSLGHVFVNGRDLGTIGTISEYGGKLYLPELLVPKIRSGMLASGSIRPAPKIPSNPQPTGSGGTIVIDPGHGGKDPGATSYLGYYEKEVNLKIANKLASRLQDRGYKIIMTRTDDTYPELEDRAALANRLSADLFVSIHCDANHSRMKHGYTIYIAPNASDTSRRAGRSIESAMTSTGLSSNGMRTNDYRVLVRTTGPAVLVECGYLTNPNEAALLYDGAFQNRIADALAEGISNAI